MLFPFLKGSLNIDCGLIQSRRFKKKRTEISDMVEAKIYNNMESSRKSKNNKRLFPRTLFSTIHIFRIHLFNVWKIFIKTNITDE
jgi:hypothetical protein